ncbi:MULTISPECIES: hypothetical protein [Halomonas]|uniref:hypothetical protein n=1 Tax=Halomonas TaxID=2745 RepID=UPI000BB8EDF2|nr:MULTISPECIES: hypothetical protein [Halomonas]PCC21866.1 hypothetical protein CIK78_07215 [Halomonas sp. JB37]
MKSISRKEGINVPNDILEYRLERICSHIHKKCNDNSREAYSLSKPQLAEKLKNISIPFYPSISFKMISGINEERAGEIYLHLKKAFMQLSQPISTIEKNIKEIESNLSKAIVKTSATK